MPVEQRFTASLIRGLAFVRKELLTVLRQPRLMATLIVGPFLILLIFGLGYRETPEPFRTLIVVEDDGASVAADAGELSEAFGAGIELVGTTPDVDQAQRQLVEREVDLLIIAPNEALQTLDRGERATFMVVHSEIDPVLTSNINLLARLSVDEFNRRLLETLIADAQVESEQVSGTLVEAEDPEAPQQLRRFQQLDPELLVSPFQVETSPLIEPPETQAAFYAPGVLIILVQHLAVTFAALSLVRERAQGITEIFHVSPLSVRQALTGKYLAFLILGLVVGTALMLTTLLLGVEVEGPLWSLVAVVALVILASLGLGFALSGLAKSDSQAVQYAMVVLLFSIFFTGFVLPLDQITVPVRWVSLLVPGTLGITGLQDVIFRGEPAGMLVLAGLGAYAILMALLAWIALRQDVERIRA